MSEEENKQDPCIDFMTKGTDEAQKVIRKEGSIWHAVFRKRDLSKEKKQIDKEVLGFYL